MSTEPSKWRTFLAGVPTTSGTPPNNDDGVVRPMLPTDEMEKRIRSLNGQLIKLQGEAETIEAEYNRTRAEMVRLQTQHLERFKAHMQGWTVKAELTDGSAPRDAS
jgi:hypothetical protein